MNESNKADDCMPHVLLLDDGVDVFFGKLNLVHDLELAKNGQIRPRSKTPCTTPSHGTICAGIIHSVCPACRISSLKILSHHSLTTNINLLATALEWCLTLPSMIINMSLGSTNFYDSEILRPIIARLSEHSILVGAASNTGYITWPASFSGVIGVQALAENDILPYRISWKRIDGVDICVHSEHCLYANNGTTLITNRANSYAAPYVTALICKNFEKLSNITTHAAKYLLSTHILGSCEFPSYYNPDWIQSGVVFCDGKIQLEDLYFDLELLLKYDELHKFYDSIYELKSDTLIFIINNLKHKEIFIELINKSIWKKNIVVINYLSLSRDDIIFSLSYPNKYWISDLWEPQYFNGLENKIDIPTVVIFDNDIERLIKICKKLKKKFRDVGYNACVVINNPISILSYILYVPFHKLYSDIIFQNMCSFNKFDIIICGFDINMELHNTNNKFCIDIDCQVLLVDNFETPFESEVCFSIVEHNDVYIDTIFNKLMGYFT